MHNLGPNALEHSPMLNEIFGNPRAGAFPAGPIGQSFETYEQGVHEYQESPLHEAGGGLHELHELGHEMGHELGHEMGHEMGHELGHEMGHELGHEMGHEMGHELGHEMGHELGHEMGHELGHEIHGEFAHEANEGEVLSHEVEIALAAELMNVQSEAELQQFIGRLVRRAGRFMRSPVGRVLTGALRQVARRALPILAKAAGTALGGPVGGVAAGFLANAAGKALGLEVRGMTQEEANFASARQFVRFATNASQRAAAGASRFRNANPTAIARTAVTQAARNFAPGLLGPQFGTVPAPQFPSRGNRGVWIRRGNALIIYGV